MSHTPTPWRRVPALHEGYHAAVMAERHTLIANFGDGSLGRAEHEANAAFIVRACNSHEAMLKQLKATQEMLAGRGLVSHDPDMNELFNFNARAIDDAERGI